MPKLGLLTGALTLLMACGCASPTRTPSPTAAPATATPPTTVGQRITTSGGAYVLSVSPVAGAIPANELFAMQVTVFDAGGSGSIVRNVQLAVDATMPAHHHGMNTRPKVAQNPDGSFLVTGVLLHMSGDWELTFDITAKGVTQRAMMPVTLE